MIKSSKLEIPDVLLLEPKPYNDDRGFFIETFRSSTFRELGLPNFLQHNASRGKIGTLRGIHYQLLRPQAKLIMCTRGKIYDIAVDLRCGSPTFGKYTGLILDDENHRQLYIPEGFGHAFVVLSELADVTYYASNYYNPDSQMGIIWDDPTINIDWPPLPKGIEMTTSEKDKKNLPLLNQPKDKLFSFI